MSLAPLNEIPASIVAADDYIPYAKVRISPEVWAYFSGGVADEKLLARNQTAWQQYQVLPSMLKDFEEAHTHYTLLGQRHDFPILLAPVAYQKMLHPDGEFISALAAAAMQTPYIISMQSSTSLTLLCEQIPGTKWLQWYWQPDQIASQKLLAEAAKLGIEAIVLTIDAPVNGVRNREQRVGFSVPSGVEAVLLKNFKSAPLTVGSAGESPLFGSGFLTNAPTWDLVEQFIQHSPLPVILKGILNPSDALKAVQIGAAGIVVSNHGGRTLDTLPATASILGRICDSIDGHIPILVDGGIRRGSDIFTALALGASAVLIGRPYIWAMAAAGASGVAHVLHILRTELEVTMALTGCRTLDEIRQVELIKAQ